MHYSVNFCRYELPGAEVLARYKQGIHKFLDMNVGMGSLVPRPEEFSLFGPGNEARIWVTH